MPNTYKSRSFSYADPVLYNGAYYPSVGDTIEQNGTVRNGRVFADANGQYFTLDSKGRAVPAMVQNVLPEVTVTPSRQEMLADAFSRHLTLSNDKTQVADTPHRAYNPNLSDNALRGAKYHAQWERGHPNASSWAYAASAAPFAVAAAPLALGIGDTVAETTIGKTLSSNIMGPIVEEALKSSQTLPWANAALTSYFGAEGINDVRKGKLTPNTVMKLVPLINPTASLLEKGANNAWHSRWAQYPRYYTGKMYYGKDVELPTLYRKINKLPIVEKGKIVITPPNNRFAYTDGTESPVITNMTTDVPVRSHGAGNWDLADVLAFPGNTLLGKNVISTRPSDTFTFGDNIAVSPSKVTFFSGSDKAVTAANKMGLNAKVSEESRKILDAFNKATGESTSALKLNKIDGAGYSRGIQQLTRESFKSPTTKDYEFMDWVFQPQYKSEVFPFRDLSKVTSFKDFLALPKQISSQFGDARIRNYLLNPNEWENVLYDPATSAEFLFRTQKGIDLKRNIHK